MTGLDNYTWTVWNCKGNNINNHPLFYDGGIIRENICAGIIHLVKSAVEIIEWRGLHCIRLQTHGTKRDEISIAVKAATVAIAEVILIIWILFKLFLLLSRYLNFFLIIVIFTLAFFHFIWSLHLLVCVFIYSFRALKFMMITMLLIIECVFL